MKGIHCDEDINECTEGSFMVPLAPSSNNLNSCVAINEINLQGLHKLQIAKLFKFLTA